MERSVDILNELKGISPLVAEVEAVNVFSVPQGYFESVPATVIACIKDEMPAGKDVPAGYFDGLSDTILAKIEGTVANELAEISPLLAGIKKINPFEVPANYFEKFAVSGEEEKTPAVLEGLNKLQPFQVPAGYFEQLPVNILNKAKEDSGAKVIAMPKRSNAIWKYAAAAIFTGMVAFGVYKYAGNGPVVVTETITAATPVEKMDDTKFEEKLSNLNEEEIIKYLEKNGSETDVAALASGIDENTLPSQEEYFTDDATLDNFLEDINTKN